jgi:hypothetical protein
MASKDNEKSMQEFVDDNKKTQAVLDLGMSIVSAGAHAKDASDRKEAKQNRDWADNVRKDTRVDPYSSMSASNYDPTGIGA